MAAGLGFKTFTTGEVLTAADVNGYLMQGILVFATEAARNSAITSPQEGQFAFTKDTNSLWYYTGSAWVASGATGDIEGVTAGVGISGGGTSGTVTITNSMATAIDAKGDLVVGTGADTFSRIAVGANATVLTADSAEATGLKWAAPASGGMTLLSTTTLSGTVVTVSSINQTYTDLYILVSGVTASAAFSTVLKPNASSNSSTQRVVGSSTNTTTNTANVTHWTSTLNDGTSTGGNNAHAITIRNYASTTRWKPIDAYGAVDTATGIERYRQSGIFADNTAITSIEIDAGGTITFNGGTMLIYGVK